MQKLHLAPALKLLTIIVFMLLTTVQVARASFQKMYDIKIEAEDKKKSEDKKEKTDESSVNYLQATPFSPYDSYHFVSCPVVRFYISPVIDCLTPPPDCGQ